jgi:hypothetical protein
MKRLSVMFLALVLALTPAATADAAKGKGGKGKSAAAKTCVAKKTAKGKKAKKARKACAKKAKKKATHQAPATAPEQAAAERECRADRRLDPEGFITDFGASKDAVAKCAAELLEQTEVEPLEEEEPYEGHEVTGDAPTGDLEPEVVDDVPAEDDDLA